MEKQTIFVAIFVTVHLIGASSKSYSQSYRGNIKFREVKDLQKLGYACTMFGWHRFSPVPMNWSDAKSLCEKEGAHLAVVNSAGEAKILGNMITKARPVMTGTGHDERAYIGIHDQFKEGEWITILNNTVQAAGYESWQVGSPDNKYFTRDGEEKPANCGVLHYKRYFIDVFCEMEYAFFCEYPSGPKCFETFFTV